MSQHEHHHPAGGVRPEPDLARSAAPSHITPPFRGPDERISRLEWLTIILTGSLCHVGEIDAFNHMRARLSKLERETGGSA